MKGFNFNDQYDGAISVISMGVASQQAGFAMADFYMDKGISLLRDLFISENEISVIIEAMTEIHETRLYLESRAIELPGVNDHVMCPLFDPQAVDTPYARGVSCLGGQEDLFRVIMHLNDHHKWPREEIADWVEEEHNSGRINAAFEEKLFKTEKGIV